MRSLYTDDDWMMNRTFHGTVFERTEARQIVTQRLSAVALNASGTHGLVSIFAGPVK